MDAVSARTTAASASPRQLPYNRLVEMVRGASDGLPLLDDDGVLPPGLHRAGWSDVQARFGGTNRRDVLLGQLELGLGKLQQAGIRDVMIGGSFVTDKARPGDVDVAWLPSKPGLARMDPAMRRALAREVSAAAPDVNVFGAHVVVGNAASAGREPGINFAEFFSTGRDGAARGSVLLSTDVPSAPVLDQSARRGAHALRALFAIR